MTIESFEEAQREFIHKRNLLLEYLADAKKSTVPFEVALEIGKLEDPCNVKTCLSVMLALKPWGYDCIRNGTELFDMQYNLNVIEYTNKHAKCHYTQDSVSCKILSYILDVYLEIIRKAAIAKKFATYGDWCGDDTLVNPYDFFAWAKNKGYTLPQEIETWLKIQNDEQKKAAEIAPQNDDTSDRLKIIGMYETALKQEDAKKGNSKRIDHALPKRVRLYLYKYYPDEARTLKIEKPEDTRPDLAIKGAQKDLQGLITEYSLPPLPDIS